MQLGPMAWCRCCVANYRCPGWAFRDYVTADAWWPRLRLDKCKSVGLQRSRFLVACAVFACRPSSSVVESGRKVVHCKVLMSDRVRGNPPHNASQGTSCRGSVCVSLQHQSGSRPGKPKGHLRPKATDH